jgi:O-antigen ligase
MMDVREIPRLHRWTLIALIITNIALIAYMLTGGAIEAENAFSGRAQVNGDIEGTTVINPIIISLMGSILAAFALGRLTVMSGDSVQKQAGLAGLVAIGIVNILLGGSRGPVIALLICTVVILLTLVRAAIFRRNQKTRAAMWFYFPIGLIAVSAYFLTSGSKFYLFDRLANSVEERSQGGTEERDFLFSFAYQDFLDAPLFGKSYVMSEGGGHPHNLVLEAMMSTGLFGMFFFSIALFFALRGVYRTLNGALGPYGYSLALVCLCFLISSLLSGSVGQFPELWVYLAIMTVLGNRHLTVGERNAVLAQSSPYPVGR